MPKVSVIIPTYNRADLVQEAIDSVLDQTFKDYEIFVVDDGSTDNTGEILREKYGDKIHYIHQENQGVPPRNVAIKEAKGEYIAFLDSDDLWLPEKLEKQVDLLDRLPDKVGLVYCSHYVQEGENAPLELYEADYRGNALEKIMLSELLFSPSRILMRKECFEKTGLFDETMKRSQDTDLWIRISKDYDIDYAKEPLVVKRQFGLHSMKDPKDIGDPFRHYEKVFENPDCPDKIKKMRGKIYANRLLMLMDLYYLNNMTFKVWESFIRALFYHPASIRKKHVVQFLKILLRPFAVKSLKDQYKK